MDISRQPRRPANANLPPPQRVASGEKVVKSSSLPLFAGNTNMEEKSFLSWWKQAYEWSKSRSMDPIPPPGEYGVKDRLVAKEIARFQANTVASKIGQVNIPDEKDPRSNKITNPFCPFCLMFANFTFETTYSKMLLQNNEVTKLKAIEKKLKQEGKAAKKVTKRKIRCTVKCQNFRHQCNLNGGGDCALMGGLCGNDIYRSQVLADDGSCTCSHCIVTAENHKYWVDCTDDLFLGELIKVNNKQVAKYSKSDASGSSQSNFGKYRVLCCVCSAHETYNGFQFSQNFTPLPQASIRFDRRQTPAIVEVLHQNFQLSMQ